MDAHGAEDITPVRDRFVEKSQNPAKMIAPISGFCSLCPFIHSALEPSFIHQTHTGPAEKTYAARCFSSPWSLREDGRRDRCQRGRGAVAGAHLSINSAP